MATLPTPRAEDAEETHLSVRDAARLATVAGQLHAAAYAVRDDQLLLRALLDDALDSIDQVRGRDSRCALARARTPHQQP
ncbi:hypothetical protein [Streptomonospora wellingtoniae]|uniref:Uncharacterized protein n=1 Tax=Streptomonospora wellingtoniae TaxID=3075544 RepID=A0ABU2L0G6_9ACTN|nr:hypothetical protein [Streptomonospora sp. DSM 45055]MDT0305049.1 hypothetical protein [Streptomonospora sp. DSM 45055]